MAQHNARFLHSESFSSKHLAARREKEIKGWNRDKKMKLIKGSV